MTTSIISKVCKDFNIPFTVKGDTKKFRDLFEMYCSFVCEDGEEYENLVKVDRIINKLFEIDKYFNDDYYENLPIDSIFYIIKDFTDYCVKSIIGEYDEHIKEIYNKFNTCDINSLYPLTKNNIPTGDVYNAENIGKRFISVDMSKAAFQTIKFYNSALVKNANTYEEFIALAFDDFIAKLETESNGIVAYANHQLVRRFIIDYISYCRKIRQIIFGKLNGKRICHIEQYLMRTLYEIITKETGETAVKFCNDEIIFNYVPELATKIKEIISQNINFLNIRVEEFYLGAMKLIQTHEGCYTPNIVNNIILKYCLDENGDRENFSFKCCPSQYRYFANKLMNPSIIKIECANEPLEFITVDNNGFVSTIIGQITAEIS